MKDKKIDKRSYIFAALKLCNCCPTLTCHNAGAADTVNSPATLFRDDGFSSNWIIEIYEE